MMNEVASLMPPFPVERECWEEYAEHCLTHDPMPGRRRLSVVASTAITPEDAEILRGDPVPLKIVVPVTIEEGA